MMKALVYNGVGKRALESRPKPTISALTDVIVKLTHTTICGTDLHIIKGDVATCAPGRILGHEGVGTVHETGSSVARFKKGDPVLISCITSCGTCANCRRGMPSHCTTGGWILGNEIDGTQAEYVRIPHGDSSLYPIPKGVEPASLITLSDIFPTALECGVLNAHVKPGSTVAIVGAGPVGLAAVVTAQLYSPAKIVVLDIDDGRLNMALNMGATDTVKSSGPEAVTKALQLTNGEGYDSVIEAVGIPKTFDMCQALLAAGGALANIGVHGGKVDLHLQTLWSQNISQ